MCRITVPLRHRLQTILVLFPALFTLAPTDAEAFFFSRGLNWRDVPSAHLALSEPKIDADAAVEILYGEIEVDDRTQDARYTFYYRFKIFDERGLSNHRLFSVVYDRNDRVRRFGARVISPDGTIREVENADIFEQEIVRHGDQRLMERSFFPPGLEVGSIVEMQWELTQRNTSAHGLDVPILRDSPTHELHVRVGVYPSWQSVLLLQNYKGEEDPMERDRQGFINMKLVNLPARQTIEFEPPPDMHQPWLRLTYSTMTRAGDLEDFWKHHSRVLLDYSNREISGRNRQIRRKAEELTAGLDSNEAKLRALHEYVRTQIRNPGHRGHGFTTDEIENLRRKNSAVQTLRDGYGWPLQINILFASLAAAAGFDTHLTAVSDRSRNFFNISMRFAGALPNTLVAIREGDSWAYFNPGNPNVPFGQLHWSQVHTAALIPNSRELIFDQPATHYMGESMIGRHANLRLLEDGTLVGSVDEVYSGQPAIELRGQLRGRTETFIRERIAADVHQRLPRAIISEARAHNLSDTTEDPSIHYDVRIEGFARVLGSRLFFNPSYFTEGEKPRLTEEERNLDLFFRYPSLVADNVSIELPEGYELDNATAPPSAGDYVFAEHTVRVQVRRGRHLILERNLEIKAILLLNRFYQPARSFFELVHLGNHHTLAIRKVPPSTPVEGEALAGEN